MWGPGFRGKKTKRQRGHLRFSTEAAQYHEKVNPTVGGDEMVVGTLRDIESMPVMGLH